LRSLEQEPGVANTPIATELEKLLSALASTDLYRPQFQKLLESQDSDAITRSHLLTVFMPRNSVLPSSESSKTVRRSVSASPIVSMNGIPDNLHVWGFNLWKHSLDEYEPFLFKFFESFDLLNEFNIRPSALMSFVHSVRCRYFNNPYHNFQHAFAVVQSSFSLLSQFQMSKFFTNLDILSLLIAALSHDVEHPGYNNAFLIKTQSPLAILYNDTAVLENHHASRCFQLLGDLKHSMLQRLSPEDFRTLRKNVIEIILATDMEQHFTLTTAFEQVLLNYRRECPELNGTVTVLPEHFPVPSPAIRILILQLIMKSCDIMNVAAPFDVGRPWFERIAMEFFLQGDAEKRLGLEPPPFMDRSVAKKAKISYDFAKFIGRGMFSVLNDFCPESSQCLGNVDRNLQILEKMEADDTHDFMTSIPYELHPDHDLSNSQIGRSYVIRSVTSDDPISREVSETRRGSLDFSSGSEMHFAFEDEPLGYPSSI